MVVRLNDGVPERFRGARLNGLEESLRNKLQADLSFFFVGPFGTGKTWAMAAAAAHWLPRIRQTQVPYRAYGPPVQDFIWTTESSLWSKIRSSWNDRSGPSEAYLMQILAECRLLCIDDIGKGAHAAPESYRSFLYELVNCRYTSNRKTFFTSNLDAEEMERLCAAAVDRIREMCVVIEMKGPSRRKPAGKLIVGAKSGR